MRCYLESFIMFRSLALGALESNRAKPKSKQDTVTVINSMERIEHLIVKDAAWLLGDHIQVISPDTFLQSNFTSKDMEIGQKMIDSGAQYFHKLSFDSPGLKEQTMYRPLAKAINSAISQGRTSHPCHCFRVDASRYSIQATTGIHSKMSPDLFITTTPKNQPPTLDGRSPFLCGGVCVEIKAQDSWDLNFLSNESSGKTEFQSRLTKDQKSLFLQILRYVSIGQFPSLPYNHVYLTTITGSKLRIWRFSPNGIQVTEPIFYQKDARPFVKFLFAISRNGKAGMGLNIGPNKLFQELDPKRLKVLSKRALKLAKIYSRKANNPGWLERFQAQHPEIWEFNVNQGSKVLETCPDRFFVFQQPIHRTTGMFSRGTRCYLVVSAEFLLSDNFDTIDDAACLKQMHMLKVAWQWDTRTKELDFFREYRKRCDTDPTITPIGNGSMCVATPLAGGQGTTSVDTLDCVPEWDPDEPDHQTLAGVGFESPSIPNEDNDDSEEFQYGFSEKALDDLNVNLLQERINPVNLEELGTSQRILQWILFEEVGSKLINAHDSRELIKALVDAMEAHHSLYSCHILHRDISINNILINIASPRGLLIDLDMAKDLHEKTGHSNRPELTGTMHYISPALSKARVHRYWHDLESFFWVAMHAIFRQVEGLYAMHENINSTEARGKLIEDVFPFPNGGNGLGQALKAKRAFLGKHVVVKGQTKLSAAILTTSEELEVLYKTIEAIDKTASLVKLEFELAEMQPPRSGPPDGLYEAETPEGLSRALDLLSSDISSLEEKTGRLERLHQKVQECRSLITTQVFPSFEPSIKRWKDALMDPPVSCLQYVPPKERSLHDLLIGVTKRTSPQGPIDQSQNSPTKDRHTKRKRTQSDNPNSDDTRSGRVKVPRLR